MGMLRTMPSFWHLSRVMHDIDVHYKQREYASKLLAEPFARPSKILDGLLSCMSLLSILFTGNNSTEHTLRLMLLSQIFARPYRQTWWNGLVWL
jgi:hypothetical protein